MMQPSDVGHEMVGAFDNAVQWPTGQIPSIANVTNALAAALTAMPDDLLRQLCAERGCVMVPKGTYAKIPAPIGANPIGPQYSAGWNSCVNFMLTNFADPRQQAQDDGVSHD